MLLAKMVHPQPLLLVLFCLLLCQAQNGCSLKQSSLCHQAYTVSAEGYDSLECVETEYTFKPRPCRTLSYLLEHLHVRSCVNITISNDQILMDGLITIQDAHDWTIAGLDLIHINCTDASGLAFKRSHHIHLSNLKFVGCGAMNTHDDDDDYPPVEYSALYFFQGGDVDITRCGFYNGTGIGVIMDDVAGSSSLKSSNFKGNKILSDTKTSGGLLVRNGRSFELRKAMYTIDGCNFVENGNHECHYNGEDVIGANGGAVFTLSAGTNITISNSHFMHNSACQGGGLYINQKTIRSDVVVDIVLSTFEHNHALHDGGGVYVQQNKAKLSSTLYLSTMYLRLHSSNFTKNSGKSGGGLGVYNGNADGDIIINAVNSVWSRNKAPSGGFGIGLTGLPIGTERPSKNSTFHVMASFQGCEFSSNTNNGHLNSLSAVGAINLWGSQAEFIDTQFWNNMGTALYIHYFSYLSFLGNTLFDGNIGNKGGALYVDYSSMVGLIEGATSFHSNHATINGGAIYVEYTEENSVECVFESLRDLVNSSKRISVSFTNNTAGGLTLKGLNQSIFIGSADGCILEKHNRNVSMQNIILFNSAIFSYFPNEKSQVSSYATTIELDYDPKGCGGGCIEVMPGEYFYLNPTTKDVFGNDAYQYGTLALASQDHISDVELIAPRFTNMDNFTRNHPFSVKAGRSLMNRDDYDLFLEFFYTQHSNTNSSSVRVQIKLTECKAGFTFNVQAQVCQCNDFGNSNNLVCNSSSHSYACVRYGYWHGNYDNTKNTTLPCPAKNCNYHNGYCPNNSSSCPDAPDLCPLIASDSLCRKGRSGFLCSKCESNYSFTFAGERCVPSSTCSAQNTAFFTLGLIAYWICLVIFVLFILSFDLSIGSGIAYGIMYYFSVAITFTENSVTESFLISLVRTSVAVTQLYPQAFGDSPICFVENWRLNLQHQLFHYVTPAAVIFLIIVVIFASRVCRCPKIISPAQNSPIHAMCILILASYTSLTYTSFEILRPVRIGGELRVYADPDLKYFHSEHLPYALAALAIECLISLPICFLILFAPCLSGKVNMVKLRLKPILDEFQACYRPECRWFAGFYFLARQLIFLVNIIPLKSLPENNTYLHSINAVVLVIHCSYQPYKLKWLNVTDTLLLANLVFLSFFHLEYDSSLPNRAVIYVLILLPSLHLALVIVLAILKRLSHFFRHVKMRRRRFWSSRQPETTREIPSNIPTHTSVEIDEESETNFEGVVFFRDSGEREPLLADINGDSSRYQ